MEREEKQTASRSPIYQAPAYRAYLLCLWCETVQDGRPPAAWRFSLQDTQTGARRGFADFEALVIFLSGLLEDANGREE